MLTKPMIAQTHRLGAGHLTLHKAPPEYALNFEGFDGLDTSIWFDYVEIHDDAIGLYKRGGEELVAEIENDLQHTSVGSALRALASGQELK